MFQNDWQHTHTVGVLRRLYLGTKLIRHRYRFSKNLTCIIIILLHLNSSPLIRNSERYNIIERYKQRSDMKHFSSIVVFACFVYNWLAAAYQPLAALFTNKKQLIKKTVSGYLNPDSLKGYFAKHLIKLDLVTFSLKFIQHCHFSYLLVLINSSPQMTVSLRVQRSHQTQIYGRSCSLSRM